MEITQKRILVYENWTNSIPNKLGTLYIDYAKGKENFSFEYEKICKTY